MSIQVLVNAALQVKHLTAVTQLVADVGAGFFTSDASGAIQQHFFVLEFAGMLLYPRGKLAEACSERIYGAFEMAQSNFIPVAHLAI